jgi:hypothetical protein
MGLLNFILNSEKKQIGGFPIDLGKYPLINIMFRSICLTKIINNSNKQKNYTCFMLGFMFRIMNLNLNLKTSKRKRMGREKRGERKR